MLTASDLISILIPSAHPENWTRVWGQVGQWECMCPMAQLYRTLCNPMDCSLPGSSVCGIFQERILEWVAISFSREASLPRGRTCISSFSCIGRQILCR